MGHRLAFGASMIGQVAVVFGVTAILARVVVPTLSSGDERPSFLAPFKREGPRPVQETVSYAAIGGVTVKEVQPSPGDVPPATVASDVAVPEKVEAGDNKQVSEAHEEETSKAFSDIEVDSAASRHPDSEGPIYPPKLMAKGIEGSVLATFIVNIDGRPDLDTYIALEATDSLFAKAVRDALPRMKFRPAKINDKTVRQLVEQRFIFKVVAAPEPIKKP